MKSNTKPLNKNHVLLLPYTQPVILSVASEFLYLDSQCHLVSNKSKKSEKDTSQLCASAYLKTDGL
jgi:hypothetical protein